METSTIGLLARALTARARYRGYGLASRVLTLAFLSARREGVQREIGRLQIEVTKRAHSARVDFEETIEARS